MKFTSLKVQRTGDKHFHGNSFLNANKKKNLTNNRPKCKFNSNGKHRSTCISRR